MRILKALKSIYRRPFRSYLLENKHRVIPAFDFGGKRYFMFEQTDEIPTGRNLAALTIYAEMDMRVDREYLQDYCKAIEKVTSDPKKINIGVLVQLNNNLRERLELMVLPEFVYKLASVIFFDETESPYRYDFEYNKKKIQAWKEDGATLDFFLKTPLSDLIPFLKAHQNISPIYLGIAESVAEIHRAHLTATLSAKV